MRCLIAATLSLAFLFLPVRPITARATGNVGDMSNVGDMGNVADRDAGHGPNSAAARAERERPDLRLAQDAGTVSTEPAPAAPQESQSTNPATPTTDQTP